jgi:alpha-glucosidase (family GH31 glycosyl hydrolase)
MMQNFFYDINTLAIDDQFMWGSDFMVIPITQPEIEDKDTYFPKGIWYVHQGLNYEAFGSQKVIVSNGKWHGLYCPFDDICVAHRGGSIIPINLESVMTTEEINGTSRFGIEVYEGLGHDAIGSFYFDDKSDNPNLNKTYVNMIYSKNSILLNPEPWSNFTMNLHHVNVYKNTNFTLETVYVDEKPIDKNDFIINKGVLDITLKTPLNLINTHKISWK